MKTFGVFACYFIEAMALEGEKGGFGRRMKLERERESYIFLYEFKYIYTHTKYIFGEWGRHTKLKTIGLRGNTDEELEKMLPKSARQS